MSDNNVTPLRLATTAPCDQEPADPIRLKLDEAYEMARRHGMKNVVVVAWNSEAERYLFGIVGTSRWSEAIPALECGKQFAVNQLMGNE